MSRIVDNLLLDLQEFTGMSPAELDKRLEDAPRLTLENWRKIKPVLPEERINFYALYAFELFEGVKRHLGDERRTWLGELAKTAMVQGWKKVLDFGCGIGTDGLLLAEHGLEAHFLDVVGGAFNFARWRAAKYGFSKTEFYPLQPIGQRYDCIICVDVLGHTASPVATIEHLMDWTHNLWLLDNIHGGHEEYHEEVRAVLGPLASQHFNQARPHLWRRDETAFGRA